jgi:hypothetical protein
MPQLLWVYVWLITTVVFILLREEWLKEARLLLVLPLQQVVFILLSEEWLKVSLLGRTN